MIPAIELYKALNVAQQRNLFSELQNTYKSIPETTCNNCASCCNWGSPPAFFIEYLNMYKYVRDNFKNNWETILRKSTEYFFLELVDENQKCPFIGTENKCTIYEVRPLTCRLYGLLNQADFETGDRNHGMRFLAQKLWDDYEIKVPEKIATYELPWCDQVKNSTGDYIKKDVLAGLISQVGKLDSNFFPASLVDQEGTLLPYPVQLMNTILGDGSRARKIKIMKKFADDKNRDMLDEIIAKAVKFQF